MKSKKLTEYQILAIAFAAVILTGSLLLLLPACSKGPAPAYIDCLFTATSATCVTGLTIYDTYTQWTALGQVVILLLIQIGGLGFMTVMTMILLVFKGKLSLNQRTLIMRSAGGNLHEGRRLLGYIALWTFSCEFIGASLLSISFCRDYGAQGVWIAVFTAVSAFCNAGFDICGIGGANTSLITYADNPLVIIVVSTLIIFGGIGFLVVGDLVTKRFKRRELTLQTKLTLIVTASLLVVGFALFALFEWEDSLGGMSVGNKLLNAFFASVTPRTAGFFSVDMAKMTQSGVLLTIMLMFIGGSSGSTAGGIKTTTFLIFLCTIAARITKRKDIIIGKRKIDSDSVSLSVAIVSVYLLASLLSTLIILAIDDLTLAEALFEVVSAIGTVGLTLGVTSGLSIVSKIILILLMYAGRLGVISLLMIFANKSGSLPTDRPVEQISVG